jgi:flavin reductase (DIM6/NTAB) family NADH-FMN oxidoreductase RutF
VAGVHPEEFRTAMGHFATGVAVVTARHRDRDYGVTVSAISSVSLEPPLLLACIARSARTHAAVAGSRAFTVNVLRDDQRDLAQRFASAGADKFRDVPVHAPTVGGLLLDGALAQLECRVADEMAEGTHTVFLGAVARAEHFDGLPLVHFRGRFGRLQLDADTSGDHVATARRLTEATL